MRLSQKLLELYEESGLDAYIDDMDYLVRMKGFLMTDEGYVPFHPIEITHFAGLEWKTLFEILLSLSKEGGVFNKHYLFKCLSCEKSFIENDLPSLFQQKTTGCDCPVPPPGKARHEYLHKSLYYQFSVSNGIKPLIDIELEKKARMKQIDGRGVDKCGK